MHRPFTVHRNGLHSSLTFLSCRNVGPRQEVASASTALSEVGSFCHLEVRAPKCCSLKMQIHLLPTGYSLKSVSLIHVFKIYFLQGLFSFFWDNVFLWGLLIPSKNFTITVHEKLLTFLNFSLGRRKEEGPTAAKSKSQSPSFLPRGPFHLRFQQLLLQGE